MKEDLLHYVWRMQRLDLRNLKTTQGENVQIQHFGQHNQHAGADFLNARIYIGDTLWAGNVEMHLRSSDWLLHQHQHDEAYNNVILHVVLEEDQLIHRKTGERIACLELKDRIPPKLSKVYLKLLHNENWIACQSQFHKVNELKKNLWLDRLLVERLESKTHIIKTTFEENKHNWEVTFYQLLARSFGTKVNMDPFEALAKSLPLNILSKHKNNLFQIEALLFGQAGMLENDFEEDYPSQLKKEYQFLKQKYHLHAIPGVSWKFLRMRPANFPTLRIAQFAVLIYQSTNLFSKVLNAETLKDVSTLFQLELSDYWLNHYLFDKTSSFRQKTLGRSTFHLLMINTIIPFLFLYGKLHDEEHFKEKALRWLEEIPPEKNKDISKWRDLGMKPQSAYQTQALLELKRNYCDEKRCLGCAIGDAVLR